MVSLISNKVMLEIAIIKRVEMTSLDLLKKTTFLSEEYLSAKIYTRIT